MNIALDDFFSEVAARLEAGQRVEMIARGGSMWPMIVGDRDHVRLVRPQSPLRRGDVVVARLGAGRYVMHRILRFNADGWAVLRGDANSVAVEVVAPSTILALVESISPDGTTWHPANTFRARIWHSPAFYPLRRLALALHHRMV